MYLNKYSNNCNHTDRGSDDYTLVISDLSFELDIRKPTVDLCNRDSKRVSYSVL
jgi:hypothetical protein